VPIDPVRFCVLSTVALIAWLIGAPATVLLMSLIGLWAYRRAMRGGLTETRCLLQRPVLAMTYLAVLAAVAAGTLIRQLLA
jgi:hypothetical protein